MPTITIASVVTMPLSCFGMASSMICLISSGGSKPSSASRTMMARKPVNISRYGRANAHTRPISRRSIVADRTLLGSLHHPWGVIRIIAGEW